MRQGQQNRRGRGRNRKSQNPLTRSFESNGPDVKIRGTPSHIAEKYVSLARDALASGDPVLAENYLQHAEHYNRIIMTFREQQAPHGEGINGSGNGRHRMNDQADGDEGQAVDGDDVPPGQEPQPVVAGSDEESPPAENERPQRRANGARNGTRRRRSDSSQSSERRSAASADAGDADEAAEPSPRASRRRERESFGDDGDQPDFLKRPVRRSRKPASESSSDEPAPAAAEDASD